jgi:hypothetical protein
VNLTTTSEPSKGVLSALINAPSNEILEIVAIIAFSSQETEQGMDTDQRFNRRRSGVFSASGLIIMIFPNYPTLLGKEVTSVTVHRREAVAEFFPEFISKFF